MTETITQPSRRADAQRNYDRIVAVARQAIAQRGANVVLEDIARDAGVGIGTLYRHFPTRQSLFEAAFLDEANELRRRAEDLVNSDSPLDALIDFLCTYIQFGRHGHCMGAAVMNAKHTEGSAIQLACVAMRDEGERLLVRAQKANQVRDQVALIDVLRLLHGVVVATESSQDPEQEQRLFDLVIAGIRTN